MNILWHSVTIGADPDTGIAQQVREDELEDDQDVFQYSAAQELGIHLDPKSSPSVQHEGCVAVDPLAESVGSEEQDHHVGHNARKRHSVKHGHETIRSSIETSVTHGIWKLCQRQRGREEAGSPSHPSSRCVFVPAPPICTDAWVR